LPVSVPSREPTTFFAGVLQASFFVQKTTAQLKQASREKDPLTWFFARFNACCEIMLFYTVTTTPCGAVGGIGALVHRYIPIVSASGYKNTQFFNEFSSFSPIFTMKLTVHYRLFLSYTAICILYVHFLF
jgi:hypothetical protein